MDVNVVVAACFVLLLCPVHGLLWAMGNHVVFDPSRICKKPRRIRAKQLEICRNEPEIVSQVTKGAQLGTRECQYQFRNRRWNCSTTRRSLRKLLTRDIQETAFVNAVTAAGVTYAVTEACSAGALLQCSCDHNTKGVNAEDNWQWGGCGDNVQFGYKKSKEFMDTRYKRRSDIKTLALLHNNEAGRLAVKNYMRMECKCHGLSGSCTSRTCWKKMPVFRDVGNRLNEKFKGAVEVIPGNDGKNFLPKASSIKPPDREDLVYSEESPNFCEPNRKTGSLGTHGRECNHTSYGEDGCDILCCGRGNSKHHLRERENCRCRFRWCCEVTCEECDVKRVVSRCL